MIHQGTIREYCELLIRKDLDRTTSEGPTWGVAVGMERKEPDMRKVMKSVLRRGKRGI